MQPKAEQREHIDSIEFRTTSNEEHLAQFAISRKKKTSGNFHMIEKLS